MFEDLRHHPAAKWLWLLIALVVANIGYYFYSNWGLVTVKAKDEPLKEVIRSIEWQGWVKIYTNLPLDTKVTMYADHVPLAEAMETLAANVDVPIQPDDGTRPPRNSGLGGNVPVTSNAPTIGFGGLPSGAPGPGGRGSLGTGGPPGGGGLGRRAQWNLAFFVGPTAADVKQEIAQFQAGDPDIDARVFAFNTQLQTIADDTASAAPDPHSQSWPGYKPAPPAPPADLSVAPNAPATPPPIVQTYLEAFAQSANIWIMAANSWTPDVANPPAPNSSIIRAVENFVSSSHGAMTQALILRAGRGGPRGITRNDFGNDDAWADRMRNAISGLPADQRPDATEQLNQEVQFRKDVAAFPPEQRRAKMMAHFAEKMLYADRSRLSPEKRAKMYQRMVAMRQAGKAGK